MAVAHDSRARKYALSLAEAEDFMQRGFGEIVDRRLQAYKDFLDAIVDSLQTPFEIYSQIPRDGS